MTNNKDSSRMTRIEDLKREMTEHLDLRLDVHASIEKQHIIDCIDHLSQNDRWKAFVPDDMVVVSRVAHAKTNKQIRILAKRYLSYKSYGTFDFCNDVYKVMTAAQEV